MDNVDNILKKILLNMRYDPRKTLVENRMIILKESNTLCKSIEDFIKDKNSCFFEKKGDFYENPFIPSQMYTHNVYHTYRVDSYIRQESIKVFMGNNDLPEIEAYVLIENKELIKQLTDLFVKSGTGFFKSNITPYVNLPTIGDYKYLGTEEEAMKKIKGNMSYDPKNVLDNGNGTMYFSKKSATDDIIIKAVNFFNEDKGVSNKSTITNTNTTVKDNPTGNTVKQDNPTSDEEIIIVGDEGGEGSETKLYLSGGGN